MSTDSAETNNIDIYSKNIFSFDTGLAYSTFCARLPAETRGLIRRIGLHGLRSFGTSLNIPQQERRRSRPLFSFSRLVSRIPNLHNTLEPRPDLPRVETVPKLREAFPALESVYCADEGVEADGEWDVEWCHKFYAGVLFECNLPRDKGLRFVVVDSLHTDLGGEAFESFHGWTVCVMNH
jgi:hypothetical protein